MKLRLKYYHARYKKFVEKSDGTVEKVEDVVPVFADRVTDARCRAACPKESFYQGKTPVLAIIEIEPEMLFTYGKIIETNELKGE